MTALASVDRRGAPRKMLVPAITLVGWAYLATMIGLVVWVVLAASLTGWDPVVVTGRSMRPSLSPGDVVLIGPRPEGRIGNGTVVMFRNEAGTSVTHRVTAVAADGSLRTQGDASSGSDRGRVQQDEVIGVGRFVVPFVGTPLLWIRSGAYGQLVLLIAITVADISVLFGPLARRAGLTGAGS